MKDLIIKIITEESKRLLKESGIRDITKLAKRYSKAKIYFHQDLDGVTTALAMKNYLEQNGIEVVDAEIIQYGDQEFSIKKLDAEGDIMPVLVDFAHGKPMFVIHTDHHDSQAGVEKGTSTNFKTSRSNVETISQSISPKEIFPKSDIDLIQMVDSADYATNNITPEQVMSYLYNFDSNRSIEKNKQLLGLVTNKLLLAFKNKPGFLSDIVMNAKPSLISILLNIKNQMKTKRFANIQDLERNKEDYVRLQKISPNVNVDSKVISQYDGGNMMRPGSYDRFTPFRNNPDADFLVIAWKMGIVQASCNPFKKERALKGINLGEVKDEVLAKWESQLKQKMVPLSTIKWVSESGRKFGNDSVGFTFKDFMALYGDKFDKSSVSEQNLSRIEKAMDTPFKQLSERDMVLLDSIKIKVWDLIDANSGGHKCITNISALNYVGRENRPPKGKYYDEDEENVPFVKFTKMIQREFTRVLKEKIVNASGERYEPEFEVEVNENLRILKKKDFKSFPIKRLLESQYLLKEQKISLPIVIGTTWKSPIKGDVDLLHAFERRRSDKKGAFIATQISDKLKELYKSGINPDISNLELSVDSKNYTVTWKATIDESKDGKAYVGISTRGSAGGGSDRRAETQVGPLKQQLKSEGAEDISLVLDFKNSGGIPIRQYFFKYTMPKKYPPLPKSDGKYVRTSTPQETQTSTGEVGLGVSGGFNLKDAFSSFKKRFSTMIGGGEEKPSTDSSTDSSTEPSTDSSTEPSTNKVKFGKIKTSYGGTAKNNIGILINKMIEKGITDPNAQIGMLVTIGKESGFIPQNELPYTKTPASRIRSIFRAAKKMSDSEIDVLKKDPKKFFDVIYGPTGAGPGLGNTQPNDGSKFIGRGFNQITGRANYKKYGYENNPEALNDVGNAAKAAVDFLGKEGSSLNDKFKSSQDAMKFFVTRNAGGRPSSRGESAASKILSNFSIT